MFKKIALILTLLIATSFFSTTITNAQTFIKSNELTNSSDVSNEPTKIPWDYKCDINYDLKIDQTDIDLVSAKYNTKPSSPNWDPKCDINKDGIVDIYDIVTVAKLVGATINPNDYVSTKDIESRINDHIKPLFMNVVSNDPELLAYYNAKHVSSLPSSSSPLSIEPYNELINFNNSTSFGFFSSLFQLNRELAAIGIPVALRYAFVAEGAALMAAIADGPLPVGDIFAIVVSIGACWIIYDNWDIIQEKYYEILDVFEKVFYQVASYVEGYFSDIIGLLAVEKDASDDEGETTEENEAQKAVDSTDDNLKGHIIDNKRHDHKWYKLFNGRLPKWEELAPILVKALNEGKVNEFYRGNNVYERWIIYEGEKVCIRFLYGPDKFIKWISTAFIE